MGLRFRIFYTMDPSEPGASRQMLAGCERLQRLYWLAATRRVWRGGVSQRVDGAVSAGLGSTQRIGVGCRCGNSDTPSATPDAELGEKLEGVVMPNCRAVAACCLDEVVDGVLRDGYWSR